MQLVLNKFSFAEFASSKAARLMSYVALLFTAIFLFTLLNDTNAITETQLKNASAAGADKSGTLLNTPVLWVINFLKGTGGLFAAVLAFVMTLYAAVVAKSLMGIVISIGIGIAAVFGPTILMSFFGAGI